MKSLLIVEDEKLIRQGLQAFVKKSGVPVEEILECRNGEEAFELLKTRQVDVLFTDVRMPKMDGLTLIRKIQEELTGLKPEIAVISGHDDFNYAVEAMRYGSREYILKPVERKRVYEVLRKFDEVIQKRQMEDHKKESLEKIGHQQLKYMLLNPDITDEEITAIKNAFNDLFFSGSYVVLCTNHKAQLAAKETVFQLESIGVFHLIVFPHPNCKEFIQQNLSAYYTGYSNCHSDLGNFRVAFKEAVDARKYAFFTSKRSISIERVAYEESSTLLQHTPQQLARRLGSKEYTNLVHLLNTLFTKASRKLVYPYIFEEFISEFLESLTTVFSWSLKEYGEAVEKLKSIYGYDTVDTYRLAFMDLLDSLHARIISEAENSRNKVRMEAAVQYIQDNYCKCLNMAMVSNHISMNYSVFSHLFKEHTGQNFVDYIRDIRINKAKELLAQTDMKISKISEEIGYENDKYFMKSFKAAVGISPTEFRKAEQINK